ncbi:MAG: hypothetical protein ABF649_21800 [Bacillus sp. (in: firmicutes)]
MEILSLEFSLFGLNVSFEVNTDGGNNTPPLDPAEEAICDLISTIPVGSTVTLYTNSGNIFGPATLIDYDPETTLITLAEEDLTSPPSNSTLQLSCASVETVSIES